MSRSRKHGEDLTYAEMHRVYLPGLYGRIGHRLDMADRDWTEFCHYCKTPLALVEEVRDVGQDLNDKATTVTRKLASRAVIPAYLMAWRADRPSEVQGEIDALNRRVRELEQAYPITSFRARVLTPSRGPLVTYSVAEWFEQVLLWHRAHQQFCPTARRDRRLPPVRTGRLHAAQKRSGIWVPSNDQLSMVDLGELSGMIHS